MRLSTNQKGAIAESRIIAAAVELGMDVYRPGECYFIPIEQMDGQACMHLRLAPARNNQELLVHWAPQYRLGAIAQLGERRAGSAKVVGSSPTSSTFEGPLP
jgi:hypothetical protein